MAYNSYSCDLDPDTKTVLRMHLFKNVQNVESIRNNVINGTWNCAVIKARLIVDPLQVAVAANRAVIARAQGTLVTRTVNTEVLYNLSVTKNISQSLVRFGVEKDNNLLICFLNAGHDDDDAKILEQVEGESRPLTELADCTDLKKVKSVYKLNNLKSDVDLLDIIISRMVTKNFVSH